jgi:hypothetical protein
VARSFTVSCGRGVGRFGSLEVILHRFPELSSGLPATASRGETRIASRFIGLRSSHLEPIALRQVLFASPFEFALERVVVVEGDDRISWLDHLIREFGIARGRIGPLLPPRCTGRPRIRRRISSRGSSWARTFRSYVPLALDPLLAQSIQFRSRRLQSIRPKLS